ncbi:predicted protein [Naegleria gruberi]|uniref:Predicted protein n=1 Tax=Naegleria gruberi TaxID=5762 RepID=D2VCR2_NAEGR|nr:uncharacterized protein NAEGRDRAFT_66663 [Naegleria gruberi]EFC45353.1 predicted protein [Naegleria gruberi]|eukprot:XP_002678097.1 predicted protein [Naegleria gruberi strain NEG-M]
MLVKNNISDETSDEKYLNSMRNVLELVLSNNSIKTISASFKKVWYQLLLKSTSDHEVCGLYKILCWILTYTKSNQQLAEFHKSLIADFHPDFYNTTSRYVKQIGSDRWRSFNDDQYEVILMLDGKVPSQTSNVKLKQTPIKSESNKAKEEPPKSQQDPSKVKNEKVSSNYTNDTPQPSHTNRMPSLKAALAQSSTVKPEKTAAPSKSQPSKVENLKQEKMIPPKTSIPQVKPEKTVQKESIPQVKPEKVAQSKQVSKPNNIETNTSKIPLKSERLNNSTMSSPSKPKIKPATPRKVLTTPPIQNTQPIPTNRTPVKQTSVTKPRMMSAFSQDEESPTTKKRERKWRKEHNEKLMDYLSNRPHLANNSFFESDKLMQQFIESYDFAVPLSIPTLAKRKYKYDQFFNAIMQATQTVIKAEKANTNKRKDPPSSSSTAKRHKM